MYKAFSHSNKPCPVPALSPEGVDLKTLISGLALALILSGCGGGGGGGGSNPVSPPPPPPPPTQAQAAHLLTQATFGPTDADITAITSSTYSSWLDAQMAMPVSATTVAFMDRRLTEIRATNPTGNIGSNEFYQYFYKQAATAPDQLRQRIALAYSEIFVVSLVPEGTETRMVGAYYDIFQNNAFGNFRTMLEEITYSPAMGRYLTYLANQKENSTRTPDENYAREITQLFTIGVDELNIDGTVRRDLLGNAIPAYTADDIKGMAKVFTGLSYYNPTPNNNTFFGNNRATDSDIRPMIPYENFHSISEKKFLRTTIATTTTAATAADIDTALDTLFNHPNVGPFISKQLIQRLVTSNPTPAYVQRVAQVFNNNGQGVRGDMKAVIKAILLDTEARTVGTGASDGKLREPIVRLGGWMRVFEATSASGNYLQGSTSANTALNQSPMSSPSVFNFFRPGYIAPSTKLGANNKVAPELQIMDEVSGPAYINTIQSVINWGPGTGNDIRTAYAKELALAADSTALVDRLNLVLFYGQMPTALGTKIKTTVDTITIPATGTQTQIDTAKLNRVKLAVLLCMASPDYLVQR